MSDCDEPPGARDPGDAVPPGVAVTEPAPLSEHDRKVREKLRRLGKDEPDAGRPERDPEQEARPR